LTEMPQVPVPQGLAVFPVSSFGPIDSIAELSANKINRSGGRDISFVPNKLTGLRILVLRDALNAQFVHLLGLSNESRENAVLQRHPLPERTPGYIQRRNDLVSRLACYGIDEFAGLIVTREQRIRRGDHCVTVYHKALAAAARSNTVK